jgi:hypothetical protein
MSILAYSVPFLLAVGLASLSMFFLALRSGRHGDVCEVRVPARVPLERKS